MERARRAEQPCGILDEKLQPDEDETADKEVA